MNNDFDHDQMPRPSSNKDMLGAIYDRLDRMNSMQSNLSLEMTSLKSDVKDIKKQASYTNGKVASLWDDKIRREVREDTLKEVQQQQQPTTIIRTNTTNVTPKIDSDAINKVLLGLGAVLTALAVWLSGLGGK